MSLKMMTIDKLRFKCFYLPICNGKCSWYQLKNKYKGGKFNLCQCLLKAPGMRNKIRPIAHFAGWNPP